MTLLSHYDHYLRKNPLATKMVTNLFICCTGDLICQLITRNKESTSNRESKVEGIDWLRVARFGAVGAGV